MNRISIAATLSLLLIGSAACGNASLDRTRSGNSAVGSSPMDALTVAMPIEGSSTSAIPEDATDAPSSRNRIDIGKSLREDCPELGTRSGLQMESRASCDRRSD